MSQQVIQGFRLSAQQKHLWLSRRHGTDFPFSAKCAVSIEGALDEDALKEALSKVVARHEILRTKFRCLSGVTIPLQVIAEESEFDYDSFDLSGMEYHEQQDALDRIYDEIGDLTVDLESSAPLRALLLRLSSSNSLLVISLPALCADEAGLGILARDIACFYDACRTGAETPDEPIQYSAASEWLNSIVESEDAAPGRSYWRKQDYSALDSVELPSAEHRSANTEFRPKTLPVIAPAGLSTRLEETAGSCESSLSGVLLACWQVLLSRLSGESHVIVGAAFDGRTDPELEEGALGLFARHLPVASDLEDNARFTTFLNRVELVMRDAYEWQDCFTGREIYSGDGEPRCIPFCFEFAQQPLNHETQDAIFSVERRHAIFDRFQIKLRCELRSGELLTEFIYDPALYSEKRLGFLSESYHRLIQSALDNPDQRLAELIVIGESESNLVIGEFNQTECEYVEDACIHRLVGQQARSTPEAVALEFEGHQLTYAELDRRTDQLASYLRNAGVGPEVVVAVCLERSMEMVIGILGILKAGGAYAPLDPAYPKERLRFMLDDTGSPIVLTQRDFFESLPESDIARICLDSDWSAIEAGPGPPANEDSRGGSDNLAYVIYTSGSTGKPKGVMNTHRAICNRLLWMQSRLPLFSEDAVLLKTSFSFDASIWELFVPLMTGARAVLARPGGQRETSYLARAVAEHQITVLQLVPSMLQLLLDEPVLERCRSLKRVFCGGEMLSGDLQERFFARLKADLINLYGPTEASIDSNYYPCTREPARVPVPIGRPIGNVQVYILDKQQRPVPLGVVGEVCIGGVGLARSYSNRPDMTAERFAPDPFSSKDGSRLYRTGDTGRHLPGGEVVVLGRMDNQVKVRGFRIELGEIEAVLMGHPAVKEAVVLARNVGPSDSRLIAYAVPYKKLDISVDELSELARRQLPDYMVPSAFVFLDALPRLSSGKIDRNALPAHDAARPDMAEPYVAPRNVLELKLVEIFEDSLGVQPVGVKDDFFGLGGHSMLAVRAVTQIERMLGKTVPLSALFEAPTVEELAGLLFEEADSVFKSSLVKIQGGGSHEPFYCAHPIGGGVLCFHDLARSLGREQPFFAFQSHGMDGHVQPFNRIEEIAAHFVDEMVAHKPEGPYLLGGWSMGGLIALEMARRLAEIGKSASLLVLIDTIAPDMKSSPESVTDTGLLAEYLTDLGVGLDEFLKLGSDEQFSYVLEEAKKAKRLHPNAQVSDIRPYFEIFKNNVKAQRNYIPKSYSGDVVLLRARNANEKGRPADELLGWGAYIKGRIQVVDVPGSHTTMMVEPHVKVMAEELRSCIDAVLHEDEIKNVA